jgi:excisionase family DNA binding protein
MTIHGRRCDDDPDALLVRIEEAARLLGISRSHVWELVMQGIVPVRRLGRRTLVPRAALEAIVAGRQDGPPS